MVRVDRPGSDLPLFVAGRRGKLLDGPFVSFAADGTPFASLTYRKGERDSALLTWDESGRPRVFAQYDDGKLNGLRCLFRACSETCRSGHLWMVQQWVDGDLRQLHVVNPQGTTTSIEYRYGQPLQTSDEASEALVSLAEFERMFDADESQLKQYVANYYIRERQAVKFRTYAASQNRIQLLASMYAATGAAYGRAPVRRVSGFR
jgi:hypothetical protein